MSTEEGQGHGAEVLLQHDAQLVYNFLRVTPPKPLRRADVGIIFGGDSIGPIILAAILHQRGIVDKIAFISGGGTSGLHLKYAAEVAQRTHNQIEIPAGMTEAEAFQLILEIIGTPSTDIYTPQPDQMTWNTKDEAHALPAFLRQQMGYMPSAFVFCRGWHARRVGATLDFQALPYLDGQTWQVLPVREPIDTKNKTLMRNITGEIPRLVNYAAKGDISPQDIPPQVLEANNRLQASLTPR